MGALRAAARRERTGGGGGASGGAAVVAVLAAFAAVVAVFAFLLPLSFSFFAAKAGGIVHLSASGPRSWAVPESSRSSES